MDLIKIYQHQKELDEEILKRKGIKEYPSQKIEIAYRVELGELAQEWKGFKYWKDNRGTVDRGKLIDELADCIAFSTSYEAKNDEISSYVIEFSQKELENFEKNKLKYEGTNDKLILKCLEDCFAWISVQCVIELGVALGFTLDEIEEAYHKKRKVNWERLNSGY